MSRIVAFALTLGLATALSAPGARAADSESCKTVTFSDVGWTDITATTAVASVVLDALGYEPETQVLSVPVTYASLKNKDVDVFLGNWMPTMEADIAPSRGRHDHRHQPRRREIHARRSNHVRQGPQSFEDIAKFH